MFDHELLAGNRALWGATIPVPPIEMHAPLYNVFSYGAQDTFYTSLLTFKKALQHRPTNEEWVMLAKDIPACAYLLLRGLEFRLSSEGHPAEAAQVRDAIAGLSVAYKAEIHTGLAFATKLLEAGGDPQEYQPLRALYYNSIATRQSLLTIIQTLLGEYGGDLFSAKLSSMRKALADDIATWFR